MSDDYMDEQFVGQISQNKRYIKSKAPPNQPDKLKINNGMNTYQVRQLMLKRTKHALSQNIMDDENKEDDKGYQMLMKLGFKGGGLGKNNQGIQEPVSIDKNIDVMLSKKDKAGLDHQIKSNPKPKEIKKINPPRPKINIETQVVESLEGYRERMRNKYITNREKRKQQEEISSSSSEGSQDDSDQQEEEQGEEQQDLFGLSKFINKVNPSLKKKPRKRRKVRSEEDEEEEDLGTILDFQD
ncbi:hypothetical protein AKO1_014425, partial [Acrasis kona]